MEAIKILKSNYIILIVMAFSLNKVQAQKSNHLKGQFDKVGFITGVGNQSFLNLNYTYQVNFFQLQYYKVLSQKKSWSWELLTQPQINTVTYSDETNDIGNRKSFEAGVNIGLLSRKKLFNDFVSVYGLLSFGPHYISGSPQRQATGFIFSDNLFVGMNIRVKKGVYLDLRPGFRHISNAGLQKRNGGINTFVFSEGLLVEC